MKKLLFSLLMVSMVNIGFSQKAPPPDLPINEDTKLVTYQEVVGQKGSPQELYDRAMIWVKKFYKNTGEVIKKSNREDGIIEMRSSVRIYSILKDGSRAPRNNVYYNFRLECRQDRYRYTITDFNERAAAAAPIEVWLDKTHPKWYSGQFEYLNQIDEQINELIKSLEEGMYPVIEKKDEW